MHVWTHMRSRGPPGWWGRCPASTLERVKRYGPGGGGKKKKGWEASHPANSPIIFSACGSSYVTLNMVPPNGLQQQVLNNLNPLPGAAANEDLVSSSVVHIPLQRKASAAAPAACVPGTPRKIGWLRPSARCRHRATTDCNRLPLPAREAITSIQQPAETRRPRRDLNRVAALSSQVGGPGEVIKLQTSWRGGRTIARHRGAPRRDYKDADINAYSPGGASAKSWPTRTTPSF